MFTVWNDKKMSKKIFFFFLTYLDPHFGPMHLTLCMLGNFSCFYCSSADFFSKLSFFKKSFKETIRVSNGFNPGVLSFLFWVLAVGKGF